MVWPKRFGKRFRDGLLVLVGMIALGLAVFFVLRAPPASAIRLRVTAGQEGGGRHRIALALRRQASSRALEIELHATAGSHEALQAVELRQVDAALVQGGLSMADHLGLRQVAVLEIEPLHLLVKDEIHAEVARKLTGLRGKTVNLGEHASGTYSLAMEVMAFFGLRAKTDYVEINRTYADLEQETDPSRLPDAIFSVSAVPSPIAHHLITEHRYRLVSLPFREAFALGASDQDDASGQPQGEPATRIDRRYVYEATIPAFAYLFEPGVPPENIQTLGTRLLLVARADAAPEKIERLLELVFNSRGSQVFKRPLDAKLLDSPTELPWHDGTIEYVRRNSPLIAGDVIDQVEKELSILGILAGGLLCLSQWLRRRYRRRRERSFEAYILQVAQVERQALALSRAPSLDLAALLQLQEDLTQIKREALERFADGELDGEELMSGFLVHASDARDFLMRLILHQRDFLEERAMALQRPAEALWREAVAGIGRPETNSQVP